MSESATENEPAVTKTDFDAQIAEWRDELLTRILRVALAVTTMAMGIAIWQIQIGRVDPSNAYVVGLILVVLGSGVLASSK